MADGSDVLQQARKLTRSSLLKLLKCDSPIKRQNLILHGLPTSAIDLLAERRVLLREDLKRFVPVRTLQRRLLDGVLSSEETDAVIRYADIFDLAVETFGNEEKANDWLRSPSRALGGKMPIDLATNSCGAADVERELGRIAYGIVS
jgi:putative toxin-antitoxin system antitoxin component (TIGR02293 family)